MRDALLLAQEAEEEVLGSDVVVAEGAGLVPSEDDDLPGPLGEAFEHGARTYLAAFARVLGSGPAARDKAVPKRKT